jgi:RNA polymerase sigma-70 factor (ECF subfamily)
MDNNLLQEIARGSRKAFDRLYLKYAPVVEQFALTFVGSRDEAADLSQDVFTKIWEMRAALPGIVSFKSWLFTVSRNAVYNALRKKHPFLFPDGTIPEQYLRQLLDSSLAERVALRDQLRIIDRIVDAMPEQRKKVFLMSRRTGLSHKEIAELLGISTKTVENHIGKALSEIKDQLEKPVFFS